MTDLVDNWGESDFRSHAPEVPPALNDKSQVLSRGRWGPGHAGLRKPVAVTECSLSALTTWAEEGLGSSSPGTSQFSLVKEG